MGKIKQYAEEMGMITTEFRPAGGEVVWKRKSAHKKASNRILNQPEGQDWALLP